MKKAADTLFMNVLDAFFSPPLGILLVAFVITSACTFFDPKPENGWIGLVTVGILALGVIIGLGRSVFEYIADRVRIAKKKKRSSQHRDKFLQTYPSFEQAYDFLQAELALDREGTISKRKLTEDNLKFIDNVKCDADAALIDITRLQNQNLSEKEWPAPKGTGLLVRYSMPAALEYISK